MKNFVKLAVCAVLIASVLCVTANATQICVDVVSIEDWTTILGDGTLTCRGPADYQSYADTYADTPGTCDDDFVFVYLIFDEYNPEYSVEHEKWNQGANYIAAWLREDGLNPDYVKSEHGILRGSVYAWAEASISYTE